MIESGELSDEMVSSAVDLTFVLQVGGIHWCLLNLVVMDKCARPRRGANHRDLPVTTDVTCYGYIPIMNSSLVGPVHTMRTQNLGLSREKSVIAGTVAICPDAPKSLYRMAKRLSATAKIQTGGPPGSRSRHLEIKRNLPWVVLCRSRCACPLFSRNRIVLCRSRLVVLQKYEA
jgi:hypothetical protein